MGNFHLLDYYQSPNLSIYQNSTQEPTWNFLVTLFKNSDHFFYFFQQVFIHQTLLHDQIGILKNFIDILYKKAKLLNFFLNKRILNIMDVQFTIVEVNIFLLRIRKKPLSRECCPIFATDKWPFSDYFQSFFANYMNSFAKLKFRRSI